MGKDQSLQQMMLEQLYTQKNRGPLHQTICKHELKQGLNLRAKTIQLLEESIEVNLHDLRFDTGFLYMISATKEKSRSIGFPQKLKLLCFKEYYQASEKRMHKIFAKYLSDKGFVSRMCKELTWRNGNYKISLHTY